MQYEQTQSMPQPDATSAEHSTRVQAHIEAKIDAAGGRISFAEFMHEALYAPGLGYYSAGAMKFGAAGDFVTAPEVSSMFGRILARQCAEVLACLDNGEILELGAGSGKLALDVLSALEGLDALPSAYRILEVSADLRERQERRLRHEIPQLVDRVSWLSELPKAFSGVIVANEVLDALPAERVVRRESGIAQFFVSYTEAGFVWCEQSASAAIKAVVDEIEKDIGRPFEEGFITEVALAGPRWIADIANALREGVAFIFDYGVSRREYYAPDRPDGWLRCHFRHHAHNNPLILPGIQDLTAWVDFSAVAGAAVASELDILGFQTQSQFLLGGGLELEMQRFAEFALPKQIELSAQIKTLTLPGEMGENFKCMTLGRGDVVTPSALQFADRTKTL